MLNLELPSRTTKRGEIAAEKEVSILTTPEVIFCSKDSQTTLLGAQKVQEDLHKRKYWEYSDHQLLCVVIFCCNDRIILKQGTQMMVFSGSCFNNFVVIESYTHQNRGRKNAVGIVKE